MSGARTIRFDPEREQGRGAGLRRVDFAWLLANAVPGRLTAWRAPGGVDLLLRDGVVFRARRRFEFARYLEGEGIERVIAYTLLARDSDGAPLDVVAWHPRTGRLATWLGRAGLLGLEHPCAAEAGDPLVIYPDPLAWLADEQRGVVVVDEALARPALLRAGTIRAADIAHGEKLKAMLERVRLPRITVPASSVRSVAA